MKRNKAIRTDGVKGAAVDSEGKIENAVIRTENDGDKGTDRETDTTNRMPDTADKIILDEYEKLKAENKRLKETIERIKKESDEKHAALDKAIKDFEAAKDEYFENIKKVRLLKNNYSDAINEVRDLKRQYRDEMNALKEEYIERMRKVAVQ